MFELFFGGENVGVYWIVAAIMAGGLVGIKLVMMNFDRKNKDKK